MEEWRTAAKCQMAANIPREVMECQEFEESMDQIHVHVGNERQAGKVNRQVWFGAERARGRDGEV